MRNEVVRLANQRRLMSEIKSAYIKERGASHQKGWSYASIWSRSAMIYDRSIYTFKTQSNDETSPEAPYTTNTIEHVRAFVVGEDAMKIPHR